MLPAERDTLAVDVVPSQSADRTRPPAGQVPVSSQVLEVVRQRGDDGFELIGLDEP